MYTVDDPTLLLALLILLLLSIVTVEWCQKDKTRFETDRQRLFQGHRWLHGFASNLGSLFSVTYFFGATVIYGHIFGSWLLLLAYLVLLTSWVCIRKILGTTRAVVARRRQLSHLLLDLFDENLETSDLTTVLGVYSVAYFGLLVEELAVARLLLTSLFPSRPGLVAIILTVISFCVVLYLYVGGFRAALKSDVVQLALLAPFLMTMIFLMTRSGKIGDVIDFELTIDPAIGATALASAFIFGIAWFTCSVDIFARFNFLPTARANIQDQRLILLNFTFLALAILLTVGMLFGSYVEEVLPGIATPKEYFAGATEYFVHNELALVAIVTLLSLYSMIFTTLDALLLNLLQIGQYQGRKSPLRRENLLKIVAAAAFASSLLDLNSLGAIGIFFGSLLLLPGIVLANLLLWPQSRWIPSNLGYVRYGGGIALLFFVVGFQEFRLPFERQLLIPGLVFASVLLTMLSAAILERARTKGT